MTSAAQKAVELLQALPEELQEEAVERLRGIVQELEARLGWEDRFAWTLARRLEAARRAREAAGGAPEAAPREE